VEFELVLFEGFGILTPHGDGNLCPCPVWAWEEEDFGILTPHGDGNLESSS